MSYENIIKDIERHWKDTDDAEEKIRNIWRKRFKNMNSKELHIFCNDEALETQLAFDELNRMENEDEEKNKGRSMS